MKALMKWGLWERRWSIFWWSISCALLIALVILVYPTFRDQSQLDQSLNQIPNAAKSLLTDTGDFLSPEGYLSSQLFYLLLPLIFSILTIGLGSSLVNREEQDGTIELLLARPVSRGLLLTSRALCGVVVVAIVTLASIVATTASSGAVNIGIPLGRLAAACTLAALLSLLFGAIAFCFSALGSKGRLMSVGAASLIAFGSYLVSSLAAAVHWLIWPAKVLPFHYYQPAAVMSGTYNWWYALAMVAVILVLGASAYIGFRSRDIG